MLKEINKGTNNYSVEVNLSFMKGIPSENNIQSAGDKLWIFCDERKIIIFYSIKILSVFAD